MRELVYADVDLVGMQTRVREVEELLDLGSNDETRVVGICGMGGIGKSTLAKVLYDKVSHHFDASYLILNATEFYEIIELRSQKRTLIIFDCDDIVGIIIRSLIIGVRENQLGAGGSRIIITTRDEGVFKWIGKYDVYRVELLNKDEALQLFCRKAFRCDFPMRGYKEQIDGALQYASGLPLAIVVLGQFLHNRRASEWSSALDELKKDANSVIVKVLKKSFDELNFNYKRIFLDIACFFIGKDVKFVQGIWNSIDTLSSDEDDMQILIEKSLMAIIDQKIQMHCLLQEMGREIVRREFPSSRLWNFDDIYDVMQNGRDTSKVGAIVLELEDSPGRTLNVGRLSCMDNLRLLIFRNVKFSGVLEHLPSQLQYISWHQYPFTSLPSSFRPYKLRTLILCDSCISSLWDKEKESHLSDEVREDVVDVLGSHKFRPRGLMGNMLRNMNLSGSKDLIRMPDFRRFSCLERLDLSGCVKLSKFDASINYLPNLKFLNLRSCSNLVSIPNDLFSLPSLEVLNLACCSKFAYCLKYCPLEELVERETTEQTFS